jgi:putative FmdB family regulatory protein
MPIYEYRCSECGSRFEQILPRSSSPAPPCPHCGAKKPEKLISAPGAVGVAPSSRSPSCPASGGGGCPAGSGFG